MQRRFHQPLGLNEVRTHEGKVFVPFIGLDHPFSNWHACPRLHIYGKDFSSSEQYFIYAKALFAGHPELAERLRDTHSPADLRRKGRQIPDLDSVKWDQEGAPTAMHTACYHKFKQNPEFRRVLFKTIGTHLVETNAYDFIWGAGIRRTDGRLTKPHLWPGANQLGETLMSVRRELALEFPDEARRYRVY